MFVFLWNELPISAPQRITGRTDGKRNTKSNTAFLSVFSAGMKGGRSLLGSSQQTLAVGQVERIKEQ